MFLKTSAHVTWTFPWNPKVVFWIKFFEKLSKPKSSDYQFYAHKCESSHGNRLVGNGFMCSTVSQGYFKITMQCSWPHRGTGDAISNARVKIFLSQKSVSVIPDFL